MVIGIVLGVLWALGCLVVWSWCVMAARADRANEARRHAAETAVDFIERDPDDVWRERIRTTRCYGQAGPLLSLSEFPPEDRRVREDARN